MVPARRQRLRVVPPRCLSLTLARTVPGTPGQFVRTLVCPPRLPRGQLPSLHVLRQRRPPWRLCRRFFGTKYLHKNIFISYPLEFAQCRMLWDDDLLRHGSRHKNGLRADSTEAGVQRRCDSSKG